MMRRKSTRNAQKTAPEKSETPPKTRRSRRRKRSPSKSSESEEEVTTKRLTPEETPDTTTKSHTPTDEEVSEEPVWQVTSTEEDTPKGEIPKLKVCLTRPSPDSPDKSKSRRSKSNSQTEDEVLSSEDKSTRRTRSQGSPIVRQDRLSSQEGDEDVEEKKGKGKSKGKHKSKIEKSPHLSEPDPQTNNEISENVQVTPQSPTIDKPVDNENDYNKVDGIQNFKENIQRLETNNEECVNNPAHDSDNEPNSSSAQNKDSDDDQPLSAIQKNSAAKSETTPAASTSEEATKESSEEKPKPDEKSGEDLSSENEKQTETAIEVSPVNEIEPSKTEGDVEEKPPEKIEEQEIIEETPETVVTDKPEEITIEQETEKTASTDTGEVNDSIVSHEAPQSEPEISITEAKETADIIETKEVVSIPEKPAEEPKDEEPPRSPRHWLKRDNDYVNQGSQEKDRTDEVVYIKPTKCKRKWEGSTDSTTPLIKIDLDSVQVAWPTIEFPKEPDLNLEVEKERRRSVTEPTAKKQERKVSVEYKSDTSDRPSYEKQISSGSLTQDGEDNSNIIAFNRKISIVDDTASKLKPPPSPAKNPISNILYITNLVRPFTVKQLKELLERTGKIQEDGFWTDRIKSKCYVQYETQEEAETTRNALHGVQWPIGNGKKLIIDYATEEDMTVAKNPPAPPPEPVPDTKTITKEVLVEPLENKPPRAEEKPTKEVEKKRPEGPIREWDIGKKDVRRDRSRSRERSRKHKRSPSPPDDFISRKQRKEEESVPQKLMDDLFLKTKATPSIYWQPLSPEEIAMKQQQRLIRMEEHKRRMEENSRLKGRDVGRGAFRRRYD